jgi:Flp pilus assembly protein TadD
MEEAARTAKQTLRRHPDHLYTLRSYGTYLSARGDLARGAQLLEKALSQEPGHPRTLHDLALDYARLGRSADAARLQGHFSIRRI